ncbi:multicopper oxidase family protein [Halorussus salinisoli]|uniref:multicopper oxidase family protein n=1 Tax=Halorussus salinisoli TaxID=2558242 RepID=UPI002A91B4CF|nr:multicopper oxidase family protein [Halorussus salinisoli]
MLNSADESQPATPRPTVSAPADTLTTVTATPGQIQPGPNTSAQNWLYNGEFPGPELRVKEGDVLETTVRNDVSEGTTIHWHGVPVPNAMDGVPDVTQQPIAPGETFTYKFRAEPAGTYFYHSHVGLQLDRGLLAPLVIEEQDPHVEYDREYTVVVDDYLDQEPRPLSEVDSGQGPMGGGRGGRGGRGGMGSNGPGGMGNMGQMGDRRPPYAGLLINGRLPADPQTFTVREGERVRLRFVNAGSATAFRVRTAGHEMAVTHADGRPVEPVTVDSFVFGAGERYDAIVEADNPGTWEIRADAVNGGEPPARALLQYQGSNGSPSGPSSGGRRLAYGDLRALSPLDGIDGRPDRQFDLTLSAGRGGSYEWLIDGQAYPDADPLHVSEGDHVRVRMVNHSPVIHPMHLHGHFFQVGNAVKDTVIVPGHMGEVTFDFVADNPGSWLFHCHNLYHLEAGMARVIQYVE